jgi:integrase
MPLTDTAIRHAKPRQAPFKLSDGGGLHLLVQPNGSRLWRLAYRFAGKQKTISCGIYPAVTLAMARARRDAAKRLLADGVDPSAQRKAERRAMAPAEAFGTVADEWLVTKMQRENKAPRTLDRARWLLRVLKDQIGSRPIGEIEPPELLDTLRNTEARGHHETVSRLRSAASQIFRYGIATGRCKRDPAADLRGALTSPVEKHRAAITDPAEVGALMRAIDAYPRRTTRLALRLLALTFVRPGELRTAEWSEFDVAAALWKLPAKKMKMREPHRVPLSSQALAVLTELHYITGTGRFLFPALGPQQRPISENTINAALRRLVVAMGQSRFSVRRRKRTDFPINFTKVGYLMARR